MKEEDKPKVSEPKLGEPANESQLAVQIEDKKEEEKTEEEKK